MQSKEEQILSAMFCAVSRDQQNALMFFNSFTWTSECYDSETSKENVSEDLKVHVLHQRRGSKLCVQSISRADCFQTHEEIVTSDKLNPASPFVKVCADSA